MFGNTLNNNTIKSLIQDKQIVIKGFNNNLLKTCQYPIYPKKIKQKEHNEEIRTIYEFSSNNDTFELQPQEHYIIEVKQLIEVPEGIVGRFTPASALVELGLLLTAGRIEHPFGENGEMVNFGLYNASKTPSNLRADQHVAYIEFVDFRGLNNLPFELTERDLKVFLKRATAAKDDGPNYGDGSS